MLLVCSKFIDSTLGKVPTADGEQHVWLAAVDGRSAQNGSHQNIERKLISQNIVIYIKIFDIY